jgi:hypothetical protein
MIQTLVAEFDTGSPDVTFAAKLAKLHFLPVLNRDGYEFGRSKSFGGPE